MKLVCLACSRPQVKVTSIIGKRYNTMYTIFNEIAIESIVIMLSLLHLEQSNLNGTKAIGIVTKYDSIVIYLLL